LGLPLGLSDLNCWRCLLVRVLVRKKLMTWALRSPFWKIRLRVLMIPKKITKAAVYFAGRGCYPVSYSALINRDR